MYVAKYLRFYNEKEAIFYFLEILMKLLLFNFSNLI